MTKAKPQRRKLIAQPAGPLETRRHPRGLTRKIKVAIDAMLFDRCTRLPACEKAGITERAFYLALAKPEVAAYWNGQLQVLRTGERVSNLWRLAELRDQDDNRNAAVKAVQVLEQLEAENRMQNGAVQQRPGFVILIAGERQTLGPPVVERRPIIEVSARAPDIETEGLDTNETDK